jgi:hypothetical protein
MLWRLPLLETMPKVLHGRSPSLRMSLRQSVGPAERWAREKSEREHRVRFEELTLLQSWGSELCHANISPPQAKHLSEGMQLAALRHTEMAK